VLTAPARLLCDCSVQAATFLGKEAVGRKTPRKLGNVALVSAWWRMVARAFAHILTTPYHKIRNLFW